MKKEIEILEQETKELKDNAAKEGDLFKNVQGGGDENLFAFQEQTGDESLPMGPGDESIPEKNESKNNNDQDLKKSELLEKLLRSNNYAQTMKEQLDLIDTLHEELSALQEREQTYLSEFLPSDENAKNDSTGRGKKLIEQLRRVHQLERQIKDVCQEAERQHERSAHELVEAKRSQEHAQNELARLQRYIQQKKNDIQNQIQVYEKRIGKVNNILATFAHESDPGKAQKEALALLEAQIQTSLKAEAKAKTKLKRYETKVANLEKQLQEKSHETSASLLIQDLTQQVKSLEAQLQDLRARGIIEAITEKQAKIELVVRELNHERQKRQALEKSLPVGSAHKLVSSLSSHRQ